MKPPRMRCARSAALDRSCTNAAAPRAMALKARRAWRSRMAPPDASTIPTEPSICYAAGAYASAVVSIDTRPTLRRDAERRDLVPLDRRVSAASRADYELRSRFGAPLKESAASLPAMKICVLGLGYVGAVSAGLLAKDGHEVIGVDPERTKVDLINEGRSPIIAKDLGEIIAEQVRSGRLRAATAVEDAVRHTDLVFVCVGTPS